VPSTSLQTEFLLQFRKQWEDSAILLASNRPHNEDQTKKQRKLNYRCIRTCMNKPGHLVQSPELEEEGVLDDPFVPALLCNKQCSQCETRFCSNHWRQHLPLHQFTWIPPSALPLLPAQKGHRSSGSKSLTLWGQEPALILELTKNIQNPLCMFHKS